MSITCRGRSDGAGAQACGIISVYVLAQAHGIPFVYTPIEHIAHYPHPNPSCSERRLWTQMWESLLGFESFTAPVRQDAHLIELDKTPGVFGINNNSGQLTYTLTTSSSGYGYTPNTVYCMREAHSILSKYQQHDSISQAWDNTIKQLRQFYRRDINITPHFIDGYINIAVHIRRGDARNTARRFVDNAYYNDVLDDITDKLQHRDVPYLIHIYSEGHESEFQELTQRSDSDHIYFHLNDDPFDTLHHFVCADLFIMSKSTFSYLGALLNSKGVVIYNPFWLLPPKPLEHKWITPKSVQD